MLSVLIQLTNDLRSEKLQLNAQISELLQEKQQLCTKICQLENETKEYKTKVDLIEAKLSKLNDRVDELNIIIKDKESEKERLLKENALIELKLQKKKTEVAKQERDKEQAKRQLAETEHQLLQMKMDRILNTQGSQQGLRNENEMATL